MVLARRLVGKPQNLRKFPQNYGKFWTIVDPSLDQGTQPVRKRGKQKNGFCCPQSDTTGARMFGICFPLKTLVQWYGCIGSTWFYFNFTIFLIEGKVVWKPWATENIQIGRWPVKEQPNLIIWLVGTFVASDMLGLNNDAAHQMFSIFRSGGAPKLCLWLRVVPHEKP